MTRILAGALLAAVSLLASSCNPSTSRAEHAAPVKWRFAIEEPAGSVQDAYAQKFKELIEQHSEGAIEVVVYPYGTLGTSDELTEQLHMNIVQFAMASPGHLGKLIPEVQVFLLHWIFSKTPRVNSRVLNGDPELRRLLNALYSRKNMRLLSVFSEGWQVWTTDRPIRSPADFKGLKMRVMTSPLLLAAYAAYGASPTPLPYGEVYSALQLHMIDGQENPIFAIQEMSFYEVCDWMIFPGHAPFIATATANAGFYDGLPAGQRQMIDEAIAETNEFILLEQQIYNEERLQMILDSRPDLQIISELTAEERAAFREASQPVREQFVEMTGESGRKLLQTLCEAIELEKAREKR